MALLLWLLKERTGQKLDDVIFCVRCSAPQQQEYIRAPYCIIAIVETRGGACFVVGEAAQFTVMVKFDCDV